MNRKNILVVDDEPDILKLISVNLELEGFKVFTAKNGYEGIELVKTEKIDLVILDVMMPDINGYQICQYLKEDDKFKDIPVIILTAKVRKSDQFWSKKIGASLYLTKPFEPMYLVEKVREVLAAS
ncbi:MAG: response regulator [Candidatus Wallbacteria bacterium]|nr:response regulator [Candidatus Wallbacteria bacterium]